MANKEARLKTVVTMDDTQFHAAIRKCSQVAVAFANNLGSVFKGAAIAGIAALTGAIVALSVAMVSAMNRAFDLGGKFNDLSNQTGGAISKLSLLELAFDNAGVGGDQLGATINKLQKQVEAGNPIFEKLGISLTNLKKQSPDEQLETVGRAIARLKTPAEQTAAAMELFGRSGGKLLAVFKDGGALDNAQTVLGSMPEILQENASLFDKIGDAVGNMSRKWDAFSVGFASKIAPQVESVIDKIMSVDTAKLGQAIGADVAKAFASPDLIANLSNIASSFVKIMSVAITSVGKLLTAGLLGAFAEPIAAFQAAIQAYANRAMAMGRGENVEEITPEDRKRAQQLREDIALRQEDFKQRGAAFAERKRMSPGYENSQAGQAEKQDITERANSIQTLTKIFGELQTRINNALQFDPESIKADILARGGPRVGGGDGKTKDEIIQGAMEDINNALAQTLPNSISSVVNAFSALTNSSANLGAKFGALSGSVTPPSNGTSVPTGQSRRSTRIQRFENLQNSVSPWEAEQAKSTARKALPNPEMLSMAGFGVGRIAAMAAQTAQESDSVLRQPSKLSAGVRKRGETKEEFKDRMAGKQKQEDSGKKQADQMAKDLGTLAATFGNGEY